MCVCDHGVTPVTLYMWDLLTVDHGVAPVLLSVWDLLATEWRQWLSPMLWPRSDGGDSRHVYLANVWRCRPVCSPAISPALYIAADDSRSTVGAVGPSAAAPLCLMARPEWSGSLTGHRANVWAHDELDDFLVKNRLHITDKFINYQNLKWLLERA